MFKFVHFDPQQLHKQRRKLDSLKTDLDHLTRKEIETKKDLEETKTRAEGLKKARVVIQAVAQKTQQNLEYHISYPVTDALRYVFPESINFISRIVIGRGKTECRLLFEEDGNEYKPLKGSGYGPVNIACIILRVCFWSLNKNRPTLILDEPFRDLSPNYQQKTSELIKRISGKLGIQIIIVSHQDDINIAADKTFLCEKIKGIARVKEIL